MQHYQLRNKLNCTNVIEKPKSDVNACEDFLEVITSGVIVASASSKLSPLKLSSTDDTHGTNVLLEVEGLWMKPDTERCKCLEGLRRQEYDKFVSFQYNNADSTPDVANIDDNQCQYSVQLLQFGCFYLEYSDAI